MKEQLNTLKAHCQQTPNFISTYDFGNEIERLYIRLFFGNGFFVGGHSDLARLAPLPFSITQTARTQLYFHVVTMYTDSLIQIVLRL